MNTPEASSEAGPSRSRSLTPTLMPSDLPINCEHEEDRALALRVYKEVWDEFNKWKVENCEQQLLLLQKPLPPATAAEDALLEESNLREGGEPGEVEVIYICESEDDIPPNPGSATVLMYETVHIELPPDFAPHPRYEFCTPAVQSIALRSGSAAEHEVEILPYVPYADDPTFEAKEYLRMFERFAWEQIGDPDVEVIQFETLRRLYFGHGLSQGEINATGVLPLLRANNREGLIYSKMQRDELFWPGMADFPSDDDNVDRPGMDIRAHEPKTDDLRRRLDSIARYFCANPSCIQAFCPRHVLDSLPVPPTAPRVTSDEYPKGDSCGSMCFRDIDDTFMGVSVEWVEPEIKELKCILEIIPDTLPCGLAKLVRKPCREVYIQRQRLIPDDKVYPESAQPTKIRIINYTDKRPEDKNYERYLAPGPCSHTGPCDQSNPKCPCAKESVHCTRACRCDITCQRRWKGCRCLLAPVRGSLMQRSETCGVKGSQDCECRKRGWECDPSVCQCENTEHLKSRDNLGKPRRLALVGQDGNHYCQNSDIQRGIPAEVEIKRGKFGLGAFSVNGIRTGEFIGEYVGELLPNEEKRQPLRDHLDLNYNFGYNPNFCLDSGRVGNETRYINHGSDEQGESNTKAETKLVFGEQRTGFWAGRYIRPGEEILFDYGVGYWGDKMKKTSRPV